MDTEGGVIMNGDVLDSVTTVKRVMKEYDIKYHSAVYYYLFRGDIRGRQIENTWILDVESVRKWFGKPKRVITDG